MKRIILAFITFVTPIAAHCQESVFWKNVGDWQILVDPTLGYGCYALGFWVKGEVVRIGFDRENENAYVLLGNASWRSLEHGKEYELEIQFGRKSPWTATATGFRFDPSDEMAYLWIHTYDSKFIDEFMTQVRMSVSYESSVISTLRLDNSYAAFKEVLACQSAMDESNSVRSSSDPFGSRPGSRDPFE